MDKSQLLLHHLMTLWPGFTKTWEDEAYLSVDDDGTFTPCGVFSAFTSYVTAQLRSGSLQDMPDIFQFIERCMLSDEEVSTAAATCFLENLINRTPDPIDPASFVPLLGPESRKYCKAWDDLQGVKTPGLW